MESIKFYSSNTVEKLIAKRVGEIKFGEKIHFINNIEELKKHSAEYVLFGIPEDIGIIANHGKPGAAKTWSEFLKVFLNIQKNEYTFPANLILLGEIDCRDLLEKASFLGEEDPNYYAKLGDLVEKIDALVNNLVEDIIAANKIPIIIGGGHNNAYGNIKGTAKALAKPINVLNIDAHTDLRKTDYRHSGNGFSYCLKEGFLNKYAMFGLHKNYTPQYIFDEIKEADNLSFQLFKDLKQLNNVELTSRFLTELSFVNSSDFGLEIDCDAINNFPSSAQSPVGFSIDQVRNFISLAREKNCRYLHICEASLLAGQENQTGKALSYFVTDFMSKARNS